MTLDDEFTEECNKAARGERGPLTHEDLEAWRAKGLRIAIDPPVKKSRKKEFKRDDAVIGPDASPER